MLGGGGREIFDTQHFLVFPQCFLPYEVTFDLIPVREQF